MIPSGGLILMQEPRIGDISDFWGTISDSNKTVSFQVTGKITLENLSVTNCNCVGFFCDRQNLQDNKKTENVVHVTVLVTHDMLNLL